MVGMVARGDEACLNRLRLGGPTEKGGSSRAYFFSLSRKACESAAAAAERRAMDDW